VEREEISGKKNIFYSKGGRHTLQLQHTALEALLQQKTQYSFNIFKDIITTEPPILENDNNSYDNDYSYGRLYYPRASRTDHNGGGFMSQLYDSLQLTKTILPGLLPLITLDDYKQPLMRLLRKMVDSNLVKAKDYEMYSSKFLIEAKQLLKKQAIAEKNTAIEKAEDAKTGTKAVDVYHRRDNDEDPGNDELITYATLLLPFREITPAVNDVFRQLLSSNDKRLKYNTLYLFMQHKIPVPDTMLTYFAKMDDYRYELFNDMRKAKMIDKFPAAYNNRLDLARSKLFTSSYSSKPDSLVFIDSLPATLKNKKGLVFFYKYKTKKDDSYWKLATVGLLSQTGEQLSYDYDDDENDRYYGDSEVTYPPLSDPGSSNSGKIVITEFTDEKIKEDTPLREQMDKQLKKIIYSKRKSARSFYYEGRDYDELSYRYMD
jgi:hypothetical protein